ncbi:MAG: hypothetical protein ACR2QO_15365, partial [Acidimicrobiales bacterium]
HLAGLASNPPHNKKRGPMSDDTGRKALHAYVSDDAHDHWHGFAAEQGVSVSAILEALAPELDFEAPITHEELGARLNTVVKSARKIDAQRRRRRR